MYSRVYCLKFYINLADNLHSYFIYLTDETQWTINQFMFIQLNNALYFRRRFASLVGVKKTSRDTQLASFDMCVTPCCNTNRWSTWQDDSLEVLVGDSRITYHRNIVLEEAFPIPCIPKTMITFECVNNH